MESESCVNGSIIDELHIWDIQGDQMEGETGVTGRMIDYLHSWNIQGYQMEGESGVTRSVIDELHSWDIHGDQMEGESGVTGRIIIKFILGISKEIKWKVKVVLLEVSSMNFILGTSNDIK